MRILAFLYRLPVLPIMIGYELYVINRIVRESNIDDLMAALDDIDTVVHLAAETGTGQSMYAIEHYSDVNVGGTALLLDLIANNSLPVKKVVVASSRAVYGEGRYLCAQLW